MQHLHRLCLFLLPVLSAATLGADMQVYVIESSGGLSLTLPSGESDIAKVRSTSGEWQDIQGKREQEKVTFEISTAAAPDGKAMLVLDPPRWLDLGDQTPPRIARLDLDGKHVPDQQSIDLGWVEELPQELRVSFKDEENPIDPESIRLTVDGKTFRNNAPELSLKMTSRRKGSLKCRFGDLLSAKETRHSLTLRVDDYALDNLALERNFSFRRVPPHRMADGTVLSVDSLTSSRGWENWQVLVDGEVMTSSMPSTAGKTWLSDAHSSPHWIRFDFPSPRQVGRVELSWAFWQVFRTSVAYDVQTWSGKKWVTQAEIRSQPEQQTSTHTFKPVRTTRLRIWQPGMQGHLDRKDLMWLAEVKVAAE